MKRVIKPSGQIVLMVADYQAPTIRDHAISLGFSIANCIVLLEHSQYMGFLEREYKKTKEKNEQ